MGEYRGRTGRIPAARRRRAGLATLLLCASALSVAAMPRPVGVTVPSAAVPVPTAAVAAPTGTDSPLSALPALSSISSLSSMSWLVPAFARIPGPGTAAPPPSHPPTPPPEQELLDGWRAFLAGRPGHVSVAMYDAVADTTVAHTDPAVAGYETASTVKVAVLAAIVDRAGPTARLPGQERATTHQMISVSDNSAANRLWRSLGGASAMSAFFARLGMTQTTVGTGGRWGLTRTTANDQVKLLRALSYPNAVFGDAARAAIAEILAGVVAWQRWGLTSGVPPEVGVEIKNGWLPYDGGWVVNSLAHVHGAGRDYVMAVFTRDSPSMQAGVETIEGLSRLAWAAAIARPELAAAPGPVPEAGPTGVPTAAPPPPAP